MGPNDENNYANYVTMTLDGQHIEFADFSAATTTGPEESETAVFAASGKNVVQGIADGIADGVEDNAVPHLSKWAEEPIEFSATFKTPKRQRCTTRKRYVKLRMADGISRNGANAEAKRYVNTVGFSYQEAYWERDFLTSLFILGILMGRASRKALQKKKGTADNG